MKKKSSCKGFTIIELVIVIVIVGVLMVAFRNVFQIKNKDAFYGESCINNLYGEVSNYFYSAITSKGIYSGNTLIYPQNYYIEFDPSKDALRLAYDIDGVTILTGKYLSLTGTVPSNYNCKTNSYYIAITGQFLQIKINKGLGEDNSLRSIVISGGGTTSNPFVKSVRFLLMYPGSTEYKELGAFEMDVRTQNIKKANCLTINNTGTCNARDQSVSTLGTPTIINGVCDNSVIYGCISGTSGNIGSTCQGTYYENYVDTRDCIGNGSTDNCSLNDPNNYSCVP